MTKKKKKSFLPHDKNVLEGPVDSAAVLAHGQKSINGSTLIQEEREEEFKNQIWDDSKFKGEPFQNFQVHPAPSPPSKSKQWCRAISVRPPKVVRSLMVYGLFPSDFGGQKVQDLSCANDVLSNFVFLWILIVF